MPKTCVNCILTFQLFFLNLSTKVPFGVKMGTSKYLYMDICKLFSTGFKHFQTCSTASTIFNGFQPFFKFFKQSLTIFCNLWGPLVTFDKIWRSLAIFGNLWQYLAIFEIANFFKNELKLFEMY